MRLGEKMGKRGKKEARKLGRRTIRGTRIAAGINRIIAVFFHVFISNVQN